MTTDDSDPRALSSPKALETPGPEGTMISGESGATSLHMEKGNVKSIPIVITFSTDELIFRM